MIQLRPSSSHMWTNCAANPLFSSRVPEPEDSEAAREGTCAAWVAEMVLTGAVAQASDLNGASHPKNGWVVELDMVGYVNEYVSMLRRRGGKISAEQFVRLNEYIAGTADSVATELGTTLFVDDLKYGYGLVEPFENTQLLIYASTGFPFTGYTHVSLGIYQPRAAHPDGIYRTWVITIDEYREHLQRIVTAGQLCQSPMPMATPGEHCKHCKARTTCDALAQSNYSIFAVVESQSQFELDALGISKELDFLDRATKIIEARKTAIEAEAIQRMKSGQYIAGWHLKKKVGRRKFTASADVIHALTGKNPHDTSRLMTPAALEKTGASVRSVAMLSDTPFIGHSLARIEKNHYQKLFSTEKGK